MEELGATERDREREKKIEKKYISSLRAGNTGSFPDKLYSDSIALLDALLTCGFSRMDLTTLNASALALYPKTATLAR